MTRIIPLTREKFAVVDDEDFPLLARFKWQAIISRNTFYARRNAGGGRQIRMHRVILDAPTNLQVDHVSGDGLDNRRCNLRLVTHSQQQMNKRKSKGTPRFKGVKRQRGSGRWGARIKVGQKCIRLGTFESEEEAARAYDAAAVNHFGQFARLNFPGGRI